ncbi:g10876 [Coccomyxa viridis]|uniref:G10876 protein n=1 Tax=Coccomyxa viridis TaxID=1274662 RepID=A0ABP1GB94_9CHLO
MSDIRRLQTPTEDDLAWLVEAQGHPSDEPRSSAPASREQQHPFDQVSGLAMLPELTLQQGSVPASAGSTFSAAASSPTALRSQVGNMERQATFPPPVSRLITTGLRTRAQAAEQPGASMEPQARLTRAASESTTGTPGASESPATRGGRPPRARSGTISGVSSVREEAEAAQRASASAQLPESPGIYRSLRKRPNLNYAQAADDPGDEDSESDASSFPMSEEEEKKATTKQAEPKKGQRGRKRRTEPIVVTKEDGTREEVSPQVYRRLRRRVTNRLSARRMRQKRAEEREAIAQETNKLQQENTTLRMRMAELEGANKNLAREAYGWRTRYEQLAQHSGLPSSQHLQPPQQPQQQAQPQQQQQQQQGSYVSPGSDRRSHSMPTPQQLPDPLQRSISPGGFDSFSLAADFPSLTMLSPQSQQQQQQQQQPPPSLTRQQLPSYDLSSGLATQRLPGGRSTLGFFPPLPPLQTASPTEIPTPQMDREQLRSSQAGGLYSGGFTHLQSPPFPASPMQAAASQGREAGPSMDRPIMSPRHYSAPNLSQGIGDIYTGPRMLEQRMASQGMAFGQQQQHAIDPGSYGQLGTQLQGSFGQPSQRRSQAARSSAGMKLSERASAPAPLPMGHLGSQPFSSHMPLPDRDTEM